MVHERIRQLGFNYSIYRVLIVRKSVLYLYFKAKPRFYNPFKSFCMDTFGKKMAALRNKRKMTQDGLAKLLSISISVIGKYERDEITPSIEVTKNISNHLNTTVGYLLEETDKANLFKDPVMLQRLEELDKIDSSKKSYILHALDGFIKSVKLKNIATL